MLFQIKEANLSQLRDAVEQFGEAWIHGDGNLYVDEQASNFRKTYANPMTNGLQSAAMYRAHFKNLGEIPTTPEALEKIFMDNSVKEAAKNLETKQASDLKILRPKADPAEPVKHAKKAEQK